MSEHAQLIADLHDESDLCRNDGANDIADLLDRAIAALSKQETHSVEGSPEYRLGFEAGKATTEKSSAIAASPLPAQPVSAAHDARREACASCGDSPEHEWVLITPEGKRFTGKTRFEAMNAETSSRIPPTVQLANIMKANDECEAEHQAELARVRNEAIEQCAKIAEKQKMADKYGFEEADEAYNRACGDCVYEIRALKTAEVGK